MLIAPLFSFPIRVFLFIRSFLFHKKLQIGLYICWMIFIGGLGRKAALYWSFEMIHVFIMFFFPNRVFTNEPNILLILSILSRQFFSKHLILSRPIYSPNVLTVCLLLLYFLGFRINFLEDLEVCIWVYQYEVLDRLIQKIIYKFNFIFHRFKS